MFPLSLMLKSTTRIGRLVVVDADGRRHVFEGRPGPRVSVRLTDRSLYRQLFINPELYAGEAYMDGRLQLEDGTTLHDLLAIFSLNSAHIDNFALQRAIRGGRLGLKALQQWNSVQQARRHIAHHYDLGNDFYRLFLDAGMLYSCAYFQHDDDTLEQAQQNKMRLIASKLALRPGLRVLDIGCGWGELALYLARVADVDVTGITLSREQHVLATEKARRAGLSRHVRFELMDYRHVTDRFDRIVSVGMFEHVGVPFYPAFFDTVDRLLDDDGVMLLHSIGHMSPPTTASPWLRKYIFPGGYSPALSEVFPSIERAGLWVADVEVLRLHYAMTLAHWGRRFAANRDKARAMYDERFCRMWEFYLVSCEAMFRTGSQMVFQMQLAKRLDAVPTVRDYVTDTQRVLQAREGGRPAGISAAG